MRNNNSKTIQRLLTMRQFPGLAEAELGELATLAENMFEAFLPAGTVVARGARLDRIHLVLEGRLEASRTGARWQPKQVFGALEVIAGRGAPGVVVAAGDTRTLQLTASDFLELLEDNLGLLSSVRRALARQLLTASPSPVRGSVDAIVPPALVVDAAGTEPLDMVERLIVLRQHEPLRTGKIQALAALAQASEEVSLAPEMLVQELGEAATGTLFVLDGALRVTRPGHRDDVASAGCELGIFEALAEAPYEATIEAITPVRALRVPTAALFDVMEDHTDFALAVLERLANALLDASGTWPTLPDHDLTN